MCGVTSKVSDNWTFLGLPLQLHAGLQTTSRPASCAVHCRWKVEDNSRSRASLLTGLPIRHQTSDLKGRLVVEVLDSSIHHNTDPASVREPHSF